MTRREKQTRRALYLAERSGDTAAAEKHGAVLASITERKGAHATATAASSSGSTSLATHASNAGGSIVGFYDRNRSAVLGTTVVASAAAGVKMNRTWGPQTPFELEPSTLAGLTTLVGAGIARALGMRRTTQMALAVSLGQGVATVGAHMPTGGLMAPKGTPKV